MSMKILHMARSNLASAPVHLSNFLNKYSTFENKCISSLKNLNAEYDIRWMWEKKVIQEDMRQFESLVDWCDVIHIHNQPPLMNSSKGWKILEKTKKPIVMQVHSEPEKIGRIYKILLTHFNIAKIAVIAQYHAVHMFTDTFDVVRNVVDIYDDDFTPKYNENEKVHVTYSPSNSISMDRLQAKWKSTWAYKSTAEVEPVLQELSEEDMITYQIFKDVPFRTSMKQRKKGDMHIDDIFTGSYHLSSLEGLSQGKLVLCGLKDWMIDFLKEFIGCDQLPWVVATKENLKDQIIQYANDRDELLQRQQISRQWMEKHWSPVKIVNDYLKVYNSL